MPVIIIKVSTSFLAMPKNGLKQTFPGVYTDGSRLYTRNLTPGVRIYGERLVRSGDIEYREWKPGRSKLAAYLINGARTFPFSEESSVLYLGAASGTTASHLSDIVHRGAVYCVEVSPRSFRDLVRACTDRGNMFPILADARFPEGYDFAVEKVEVVYQDIAQRDQLSILDRNMRHFSVDLGILALKSRSEDVSLPPKRVYRETRRRITELGLRVLEVVPLDPYAKDHAMFVVRR